jgi:hypothetical protein
MSPDFSSDSFLSLPFSEDLRLSFETVNFAFAFFLLILIFPGVWGSFSFSLSFSESFSFSVSFVESVIEFSVAVLPSVIVESSTGSAVKI